MDFVLKPSLEHMALVKIAISLWNQSDVRALIAKQNFTALISEFCPNNLYPSKIWETIEESVRKKVTHLSLPQVLKERVFGVIKPIGLQILIWMNYNHMCLNVYLPIDLCWTLQGTIDKKKTAEMLVRNENLDIFTRYKLACDYCLEDDIIRLLWNGLPEDLEKYDWQNFPIRFLFDNMMRGVAGHISYKDAFYLSAIEGSKISAKYFLEKLTPQERKECFEWFPEFIPDDDRFADVLCFLLPEMKEEEQQKVLKNFPIDVLQSFLQWPLQSFFIGVTNCMWDFLSAANYEDILVDIIDKVREGYRDYNYQKLFREFWQKSPKALKDSLIQVIDNSLLMRNLCDMKDKENIKLILKDATLMKKDKLIDSDFIVFFCLDSIYDGEWDNIEFYIRECLSSKNEMLKFKKKFEKSMYFKEFSTSEKHKWNQLFPLFDDSICKYGKRSQEEGQSSSSKRFQSYA